MMKRGQYDTGSKTGRSNDIGRSKCKEINGTLYYNTKDDCKEYPTIYPGCRERIIYDCLASKDQNNIYDTQKGIMKIRKRESGTYVLSASITLSTCKVGRIRAVGRIEVNSRDIKGRHCKTTIAQDIINVVSDIVVLQLNIITPLNCGDKLEITVKLLGNNCEPCEEIEYLNIYDLTSFSYYKLN